MNNEQFCKFVMELINDEKGTANNYRLPSDVLNAYELEVKGKGVSN